MTRRSILWGALAVTLGSATEALGFARATTFHVRLLTAGGVECDATRRTAPARWAWELARRTSAPSRLRTETVAAHDRALVEEPWVVWAGRGELPELSRAELSGLHAYLRLGGLVIVDDSDPERGDFIRSAKRELGRVLPDAAPARLPPEHVIFKSYYLLERPVGRVLGPPHFEAIVRGGVPQVIFLGHDLLGALARRGDTWSLPAVPGGARQREAAVRTAVNLAMYALCSDYKDDQVHASWLMRRRSSVRP
jgi:hypothetical protein